MPIYEKFVGRHRDDFTSLQDAYDNYKVTYPDNFNFAYDVVDQIAKKSPDKLAIVWISKDGEEKRFTFSDVARESAKVANYLMSEGVKKGDRVLLVLKRSYYFWFILMALHKIGAVAVQATNMLKPKDYIYRCNRGEIKYVIITGDDDCTEQFDCGEGQYETVCKKFVTGHKNAGEGWIDFEAEYVKASDELERIDTLATDVMLMAFSSGTTGYPKIITHAHTYPLGHIMTGVFWHRVEDGGLHFTISDTGWLKSLWGKMYGQWFGESAVFIYDFDKFDGADILSKLEKYKVTTFCVPPTMYRLMLQNDVSKYDLSSIKHCCTAGEALNPEIFNKWLEATGLKIYEGFGQTETTVCISTLRPWMEPRPGSMGLPTPGFEVNIVDEDGNLCQRGTTGEICIRATMEKRPVGLLHSYFFDDKETEKSIHNGFYHTGDTAYRDEKGYFNYVGRNDDVIKSSGYRIGPFEIESVLMEHPAVFEVAVTGVPDPVRGFNVKATIVLAQGYEGSDELVRELQTYVKKNTAPYKYPRVVEFVSELPKTVSGKIRRVEIRDKDREKQLNN